MSWTGLHNIGAVCTEPFVSALQDDLDPHLAPVYLAWMTCSLYIRQYSSSCQACSASSKSSEPVQSVHIQSLDCGQCILYLLTFGIFSAKCQCCNVREVLLFSELLCACSTISTSKLSCLIRYVYILTYSLFIELYIGIPHTHRLSRVKPVNRQWSMFFMASMRMCVPATFAVICIYTSSAC